MNTRNDHAWGEPQTTPWRRACAWIQVGWAVALAALCMQLIFAHRVTAAGGGVAPSVTSPLADPVVHADAIFFANKVTAWDDRGASYLLLEGDAGFSIGVYGFRADTAVVRIDTEIIPGKPVRHLSIYLDNARHLRGMGPVSAQAKRLLVTASTYGGIQVQNNLFLQEDNAPNHPLIAAAKARLQRRQAALARVTIPMPTDPLFDPAIFESRLAKQREGEPPVHPAPASKPQPAIPADPTARVTKPQPIPNAQPEPVGGRSDQASQADVTKKQTSPVTPAAAPTEAAVAAGTAKDDPVLPTKGTLSLIADRVVFDQGDEESTVMLIGNVRLFYGDYDKRREVSLQAERVVVFLDGRDSDARIAPNAVDAGRVRGIYLEDNVIVADTGFTVRAPRVYYDVRQNKATLLEAVMYSFDATRQMPLYMRAETVRQTSATSFQAENVLLTTSEFAEPHFAIGAARITLDQEQIASANPGPPGSPDNPDNPDNQGVSDSPGVTHKFTATDTTLRVRNKPIFFWPYLEGSPTDIPLKSARVGNDSQTGPEVRTTWDVFALAGREAPEGVKLEGRGDVIGSHGPAAGADLEYGLPGMFGQAQTYLVLDDNGEDTIGGRNDVEQDGGPRGFFQWQHRQYLDNGSELSIESAYISDETFLEEFFRRKANEDKPYETSIYWKRQEGDRALTFLTRYDLTDFTPQLTTLQTPGYAVDKAPEVAYYRTGTSFGGDRLTWFSENRAGFVRARPGTDSPSDRGFRNNSSMTLFGMPNTTAFDDALFASGVPDEWVFRADSRQEVSVPMNIGDVKVAPYAVGRITAYDEDFSAFAGEDEKVRLFGSLGVRATTSRFKTYDKQSQLLDINGLRHVVEPSVDVFFSGANIDSGDLPIYDADIEGLQDGAGLRLGLTNTLQTKRGGPGRWRSVDWIMLKTDLVLRSDDSDVSTDIARFFEQRPEYSVGGDHLYTELLWMVTDTLGLAGELTHSLETDRVVQWRFGGTLQHTPRFSSFVRYDEIDTLDSRLLSYGFTYILTVKYEMGFQQRIDFARDESRSINLWLERRVPQWRIRMTAKVDEIENNQTLGIFLIPEGFGGGPGPLIR